MRIQRFLSIHKRFAAVFVAAILVLSICSCVGQNERPPELSVDGKTEYPLTVSFLNVGKADCILLETPSGCAMIDTGHNGDGDDIVQLLSSKGIETIDFLVITHFDKDHVGGADAVLKSFPVEKIYEPDYTSETKQTAQYRKAIPETTEVLRLSENVSFKLDGIDYSIDVGSGFYSEKNLDNNSSLVVTATCGEISFLFTGDAEKERLLEMLYEDFPKCAVLKVPHHGQAAKYLRNFIDKISPSVAVITSEDSQPEDASVVSELENAGAMVYLTRQGRVTVTTDGKGIHCLQEAGTAP